MPTSKKRIQGPLIAYPGRRTVFLPSYVSPDYWPYSQLLATIPKPAAILIFQRLLGIRCHSVMLLPDNHRKEYVFETMQDYDPEFCLILCIGNRRGQKFAADHYRRLAIPVADVPCPVCIPALRSPEALAILSDVKRSCPHRNFTAIWRPA